MTGTPPAGREYGAGQPNGLLSPGNPMTVPGTREGGGHGECPGRNFARTPPGSADENAARRVGRRRAALRLTP